MESDADEDGCECGDNSDFEESAGGVFGLVHALLFLNWSSLSGRLRDKPLTGGFSCLGWDALIRCLSQPCEFFAYLPEPVGCRLVV